MQIKLLKYAQNFLLFTVACLISYLIFNLFYMERDSQISGELRSNTGISIANVSKPAENIDDVMIERVQEENQLQIMDDIPLDTPVPELQMDMEVFSIPKSEIRLDISSSGIPTIGSKESNTISNNSANHIYKLGEVDTRPVTLYKENPVYPRNAKNRHIEGNIIVKFMIDKAGNVVNARILAAKPKDIFNASVLSAVKQWNFQPAIKDGMKVNVWMIVPFEFSLESE